ncbi:uncharacterized protein LOC125668602 isoform X3 [Ostrea edulis]|uniref:uncharacterized protein LOC125668602 isoform X3 n=1 Tax=Ostrea edulis TaxID=37623 RepID=UPI0024AFAA15|nr:uncharacterized protein LOC125668602 isoform X3 [Ostrea edulis]
MAVNNATEDVIKWTDETYSMQEVANNNLPTIVKVADGYYSENEAESFSNGDLIKLDFKKSYSKVRAQCVGGKPKVDTLGYMSPDKDILIPIGYKGKLKVECLKDTFGSIQELITHFPHFVITGRPLTGKRGIYSSEEIRIEKGTRLQLDRVIPDAGLVCRKDEKEILLPSIQLARFYLEPDEKEYTVREVVDNFKLPQYIRFIDSDFEKIVTADLTEAMDNISHFEGYLKIVGLVQQEVVVGHHKPSGVAFPSTGNVHQRSIAILPLDSDAVRNIEVYLPVYEEENDYEFFLARNFSKNVNMDLVDGGLYLEFNKCPRIHLLNTEAEEAPPPRPPPPKDYIPVSSIPISSMKGNSTDTKDKSSQGPARPVKKKVPPPVKAKPKNVSPKKGSTNPKHDSEEDDDADDYEEMCVSIPPSVVKPSHRVSPHPRVQRHVSIPPLPDIESSDDEPERAYDEIPDVLEIEDYSKKTGLDFSVLPKTFRVGLKRVHTELKKLRRGTSVEEKSLQDLRVLPSKKDLNPDDSDSDDEEVSYDYPDLSKLASMKRPPPVGDTPRYQDSLKHTPSKPIGKIQPMSRGGNLPAKFSEMTTEQTVSLFKETKLPSLASVCEKEGLDGSFFSTLSDTQLKSVFKLSDLQVIKLHKIINEGWRPNLN